jgi:hypothetical protein
MDERYETLCAAMMMLDAVQKILYDAGICEDEINTIHKIRNDMNDDRLALLGNGQDRPFHVAEITQIKGPKT